MVPDSQLILVGHHATRTSIKCLGEQETNSRISQNILKIKEMICSHYNRNRPFGGGIPILTHIRSLSFAQNYTPQKANLSPENWWLEDEHFFWDDFFLGWYLWGWCNFNVTPGFSRAANPRQTTAARINLFWLTWSFGHIPFFSATLHTFCKALGD